MRSFTRSRVAVPLAIAGALAMASAPVLAQDASTPADPFGPAEKADLTIAIPFPDIVMYGRYYIADEEGYFEDEGLTVDVVTADSTVAAVASGSADIGAPPAIAGGTTTAADGGSRGIDGSAWQSGGRL